MAREVLFMQVSSDYSQYPLTFGDPSTPIDMEILGVDSDTNMNLIMSASYMSGTLGQQVYFYFSSVPLMTNANYYNVPALGSA